VRSTGLTVSGGLTPRTSHAVTGHTGSTGSYYNGYASKEDYDLFTNDKNLLRSSDELLDADGTVRTIYDGVLPLRSHLREDDYQEGACMSCNTCIDCNEHMAHCLCYTPSVTARK